MKHRLALSVFGLGALLVTACGPSSGAGKNAMTLVEVSNGFGRLLPHMIFEADANGDPTGTLIAIRTLNDLVQNVTPANPIRPTAQWPVDAELPTGAAGNHFLYAEFSQPIDIDSVLGPNGLTGAITVVEIDGATGNITPIPGTVYVGGMTYVSGIPDPVQLVQDNGDPTDGKLVLNPLFLTQIPGFDVYDHPAEGFPGAAAPLIDVGGATVPAPGVISSPGFLGADVLASPNTLVFIPDEDDALATYEGFPTGVQVRMRLTKAVLSTQGKALDQTGLASGTVGDDVVAPEVTLTTSGGLSLFPPSGATNVDPAAAEITMEFTEPIQLQTISTLEGQGFPNVTAPIQLTFGPSVSTVTMPFSVRVESVYDLTRLVLVPAYDFPPNGPASQPCNDFNRIDVTVFPNQFQDLAAGPNGPNLNTQGGNSFFFTGQGVGIVNAPVAPDAIYVGRFGGSPSISVIDLNGFGASTGNPTYDIEQKIKQGNTNYPNNPNVVQGSFMIPVLQAGTCTFNGGSEGVFSLTKNSALDDRLIGSPELESIEDMMLGHPLDTTFNNGPPPFGCQAGGGNSCAFSGFKNIAASFSGNNTLQPTLSGLAGTTTPGGENIVAWSPHPNPPPLVYPPLCLSPFIGGQEPTSIDTSGTTANPFTGISNLLTPGSNALGNPQLGQPPSTLLVREQNGWFEGPSPPAAAGSNSCQPFQIRQQVGHFLYVVDRVRREIVVLNSNRMTVIDRIPQADPAALAISPNLDRIAVTNQSAGVVSFIDINPNSSNFHTVVKETDVGLLPSGIAWQPDNEDLFVCNEGDNSVSVISAFSLEVRKTLTNQLNAPFDVAITPRQTNFGFSRNVYFAYILNRDGSVSIFESGPDGANGWGFDEVILQTAFHFDNPRAIQVHHTSLNSGVWIVHENQVNTLGQPTGLKGGAVSALILTSATAGQVALPIGNAQLPTARNMEWSVPISIGSDTLTGVPVDIAFDNQMNLTGLPNPTTVFSPGSPASLNGKSVIRFSGATVNCNEPQYMFLAIPNSTQGGGVVDVIPLNTVNTRADTNVFVPGIQSIPAPGVQKVMDFFRQ